MRALSLLLAALTLAAMLVLCVPLGRESQKGGTFAAAPVRADESDPREGLLAPGTRIPDRSSLAQPGEPVAGRVEVEGGLPPEAALVVVAHAHRGEPSRPDAQRVDAPVASDGTFALEVPRGTRSVSLDLESDVLAMPAQVEVEPGRRDIVLQPRVSGAVRGRVHWPAHLAAAPSAGETETAQIRLECGPTGSAAIWTSATADASGSFALCRLPVGAAFELRATARGGSARLQLEPLRAGEVRVVELVLAPPSPPGTAVAGIVLDDAGRPLAGAEVIARDALPFLPDAPAVHTADDGRFRVEDLRPGTWELEATAPGFERGRAQVELPAEADAEQRFVLQRAALVSGRVLAPDGSACAQAIVIGSVGFDSFHWGYETIWVFPSASGPDERWAEARSPRVDADGAGCFTLGIDSGRVRLAAWAPDYAPAWPVDLTVGSGEELDGVELRLRRACRLEGRALDEVGRPLDLWLTLRALDGTSVTLLASEGQFGTKDLPEGSWKLAAADRGGHEGELDVVLAPERDTRVVLRLRSLR